ncbi:hypothetical protein [Clostridium sp.]|uniref:hypothetical protein n=1 Tax=Clostridium sp. TaxID=1506 RepID=UPI002611DEA2|nr:hypothetical protein [Clostridium sp.]
MTTKPMTKQEKIEWDDLYQYVKKEILQYDAKINLPRTLVLRLKGLHEGKFMANTKTKPMADYTYKLILMTFKLNKFDIIKSLSNKDKFKDEKHMINYLMAIIESKINDTYLRIKKVEESQEKGQEIEINISDNKAEYKKKTKEIKNSRLQDLL